MLNDYFTSVHVYISEDGSMPTLDGSSFPDISPLLMYHEGVANLLSNLDDHKLKLVYQMRFQLHCLKTGYSDICCSY